MAEKEAAQKKAYSYSENSNLVLSASRSNRDGEATGEVETLKGKLTGTKMGDRVAYGRPKELEEKMEKAKKKRARQAQGKEGKKSKAGKKARRLEVGSNVLQATEDSSSYRPKTRETRIEYEKLLTFIQKRLGDQPQDVLRGAADEVLALLKDDALRDSDRKREAEQLLSKMSNEDFHVLVNMGKGITDFSAEDLSEAAARGEEAIDDNLGVAVVFDEDSDSGDDSMDEVDDQSDDDDDEPGAGAGDDMDNMLAADAEGEDDMDQGAEEEEELPVQSVDAFWLQRKVAEFYPDEVMAQKMTADVMRIMSTDQSREVENNLVLALDYDKFDFIKLLLKHRSKIVYCTRLGQAQTDSEKESVREEMRSNPELAVILAAYDAPSTATDKDKAFQKQLKQESRKLRAGLSSRGGADGGGKAGGRNVLDLEDLQFAAGAQHMSNKRCELPQGSTRTQKKGYEEVHVPALAPKQDSSDRIPIKEMPAWAQPAFDSLKDSANDNPKLNRVQSKVYQTALFTDENMLICAPTGAGKTNVAMLAMLHQIGLNLNQDGTVKLDKFKMVYVAPMKALVQECVGNFGNRLKPYGITVRELTGDSNLTKQQIEETQLIITTPEKWDIITRKAGDRTFTQLVKLVIIDEIHLLHDTRGQVLESLVARTIRQIETTQELVRLVGLSATLPNYEDVATFLRVDPAKGLFFFDNSYRSVPLFQQYIGITERKPLKRMQLMNEIVFEKVMEDAGKDQVIVFVHTRKETAKTAKALVAMAIENDCLSKFVKDSSVSHEVLQQEVENVKSQDLKELLPYGFGIHHAGMNRLDRTLVEDLFAEGHIQVLVSTATLAWGVNLPAHSVIIKGTQVYNPEKGHWCELSPLDIMQMVGRAGRPQFDTEGHGILITGHSELQYYLSLLNQQLPIESQYITNLADNLNAEIVLGTVQNLKEAANWLGYTYLFVRMLRNPAQYGVSVDDIEEDPLLERRRLDLIHSAATLLDRANLIKYDRRGGHFQVTDLGRVASHFYISHESIATYNEHLKPSMSDIELFRLFALSKEFKYMVVREEEKSELQRLLDMVPIPVKETVDDPSSKVNVLLQAYISNLKLEGFALVSDMVYITQSVGRIMRALYEIVLHRPVVLKKGWAQLADRMLTMCKMVDHKMWPSQSPLRQFRPYAEHKNVTLDVLKSLEKKDISFDRLYDITAQEIGELIRDPKKGKAIYKAVHQFPRLDLVANVQPITRSLLRVELVITPDFRWEEAVHGTGEGFWVIVEDVDGDVILHHEYFLLRGRNATEEHVVSFTVPITEPMPPQYFVKVVSDRWLGSSTTLPVSFKHLLLPDKYPPHTELLDLQPLPVSALRWPEAEQQYTSSYKYFNPIQTQVFSALYSTDSNVLVAAPTGSGKTVCAEFAMLRLFQSKKKAKCVYVAPLQSLASERMSDWNAKFGEGSALGKTVVMLTGENAPDLKLLEKGDIIISTPEHWDVVSRRWRQRKNVQLVNLFMCDELHLIGGAAGPTLEVVVSRMRYISSQLDNSIRIVGLCTSLANARDLGEWIGATGNSLFNFLPTVRPVPLEIHLQGFNIYHVEARQQAMVKPTYSAIVQHCPDPQQTSIVFVPSRKLAKSTALELVKYAASEDKPERFLGAAAEDIEPFIVNIKDATLQQTLRFGVAFLHESLHAKDRMAVEQLFSTGAIQVCVSSHSMCWGMTITGHCVVIMGTQAIDSRESHAQDYPITDILQMMGRASRPLVDDSGVCCIFCHAPRKELYRKFVYDPFPVESHLDHTLSDHLNAEVVTKTVETKQDAVDYLTWTFLYRRLTQNPNYYGLTGSSHKHLSDQLSELVEQTLSDLEASKCVAIEDDFNLSPLNLGMIASFYYVKYTTIELYSSSIAANTKIKGVLEILSSASEYDDLPIRAGESGILEQLSKHLPQKLGSPDFNNPQTKANILFQAHFSRMQMSHDLDSDRKTVIHRSVRLLQALVDVISSHGWLSPALAAMELSQMVTQSLWDRDSPLMQLPYVTKDAVARCAAFKKEDGECVESVFDIMDLTDAQRNELLQVTPVQMAAVAQACNQYPNVELTYEVVDSEDLHAGSAVQMVINIVRETEDEEDLAKVHCPQFGKDKEEEWWVVLGDPKTNQLISIKRTSFMRKTRVKLDFTAPAEGEHNLMLYFMADSYMGCDQEYEVALKVLEGEDSDEDEEEDED